MLLAAIMYGFSNIFQEFLVSKITVFEVLGQLGFWGMIINGTQSAIFDRQSFRDAQWNGTNGGYLAGYTLLLFLFCKFRTTRLTVTYSSSVRRPHPRRDASFLRRLLQHLSIDRCLLGSNHRRQGLWLQHLLPLPHCIRHDHPRTLPLLYHELCPRRI
jgi:hypothetical protein